MSVNEDETCAATPIQWQVIEKQYLKSCSNVSLHKQSDVTLTELIYRSIRTGPLIGSSFDTRETLDTATVGVLNLCEGEKWVTGLQSPTTLLYTTKSCTLLLYWDELCSRVGQLVEYISCGHTNWAEEQFILIRPKLLIAGTEERSGRSFILFLSFESSVCFTQLMSQLNHKRSLNV